MEDPLSQLWLWPLYLDHLEKVSFGSEYRCSWTEQPDHTWAQLHPSALPSIWTHAHLRRSCSFTVASWITSWCYSMASPTCERCLAGSTSSLQLSLHQLKLGEWCWPPNPGVLQRCPINYSNSIPKPSFTLISFKLLCKKELIGACGVLHLLGICSVPAIEQSIGTIS